jgi:hypothetical protein
MVKMGKMGIGKMGKIGENGENGESGKMGKIWKMGYVEKMVKALNQYTLYRGTNILWRGGGGDKNPVSRGRTS